MHWLKYFLVGVDETARQASETLSEILRLKEKIETDIRNKAGRRTHTAFTLLTHLFRNPAINVKQAAEICNISTKAANDLITFFEEQGILIESSGQIRYRVFVFEPYLRLFR